MLERDTTYFRIVCTIFWIEACFGFVADDLTFLQAIHSPLMLLLDFVFFVLGIACLRRKTDKWIIGTFLGIAFLSTVIVNHCSLITYINGSRTYFSLMMSGPIIYYLATCKRAPQFKKSLERQLFIFLALQAFCVTSQFLRFGANDAGGGSFGYGSSGIISLLILAVSFYFISRDWDADKMMVSLRKNWKYAFLVFPIFLNETKVSFVILAVYILLLFKPSIKSVGKAIMALPVLALVALGAYYAYDSATNAAEQDMDVANSDFIEEYLTGGSAEDLDQIIEFAQDISDGTLDEDIMGGISDVPRFAKIGLIPMVLPKASGGWLLGAGVGMFKGGTNLDVIPFQKEFEWTFNGTIMVLLMLIYGLGICGLGWYIWVVIYNARVRHQPVAHMGWQVRILLLAEMAMILVYNDAIRQFDFAFIIFLLFALVNYEWKHQPKAKKEAAKITE